jgi:hypothetical protein
MRLLYRRVLGCFLLALFAGSSILGEGLHLIEGRPGRRHHHCHHRGHWILTSSNRGHRHETGDDQAKQIVRSSTLPTTSSALGFSVNNLIFDSDVCSICAYLLQAASPAADVALPFDWQPLVFAGLSPAKLIYTPVEFSSQTSRGPPVVV